MKPLLVTESIGKDELWAEFFTCPNKKCDGSNIVRGYKFCPDCGKSLTFDKPAPATGEGRTE